MKVDNNGNVVVTGRSGNGNNPDYYTAKYAAMDGTLLWEKRYNGPADSYEQPESVAVDDIGDVVVTGISRNASNDDYYTAKYAAADGALLWERRHNGLANNLDQANALAVDGSGNVVVTGYSYSNDPDYYTAKYAAADGALLWEKRYKGPANGDDRGVSLALGRNGMVAITGYSSAGSSSSSSLDYATVVYQENLPPVSIAFDPTGVRIRFSGDPGRSYTIERSPDVTGPWSTLAMPTVPIQGVMDYIDTNPPAAGAFYRTSER